jgi:hypothetical protein
LRKFLAALRRLDIPNEFATYLHEVAQTHFDGAIFVKRKTLSGAALHQ